MLSSLHITMLNVYNEPPRCGTRGRRCSGLDVRMLMVVILIPLIMGGKPSMFVQS